MDYPDTVLVKGEEYRVNTDYRNVVGIITVFHDDALDNLSRSMLAYRLFYKDWKLIADKVLLDSQPFGDAVSEFMLGKKERKVSNKHYEQLNYKAAMGLIVAGFQRDYGIDISDINYRIHWHKFTDMLRNLSQDNLITKILGWYYSDSRGKKGDEIRQLNKIKTEYAHLFYKQKPDDELINVSEVSKLVKQKLSKRKNNGV